MPIPSTSSTGPRLTRRAVATGGLSLVAATLGTGCSGADPTAPRPVSAEVADDPDLTLVLAAIRDERRLLDRIERTRARHPRLRADLAVSAAVHRAHVRLLSDALRGDTEQPTPTWKVPPQPQAAVTALRTAERALAAAHVEGAMSARSGTFAQLLAVMAAAAAQQERGLAQVVTPRGRRR